MTRLHLVSADTQASSRTSHQRVSLEYISTGSASPILKSLGPRLVSTLSPDTASTPL